MALRPRSLAAIPPTLRSLLAPAHPPRHMPALRAVPTQRRTVATVASPPAPGESLLDLWAAPSAQITPAPNPFSSPTLSAPWAAEQDVRAANDFFLVKKPEFLYSATSWRSHEVNYYVPEVCVLGCSNAGKSTFINSLLGSQLARRSWKPGSTREMNAYAAGPVTRRKVVKNLNVKGGASKMDRLRGLVLMDTPGYGYNSIKAWGDQIEEYLERRTMLKGVVLLLRGDIPLTTWDGEVLRFLARMGKRTTIILTRADRCGEGTWRRVCMERYAQISEVLDGRNAKGKKKKDLDLEDADWTPEVCLTAAGMADGGIVKKGKLKKTHVRDEAGMGGARIAVLRLAGVQGPEAENKEPAPEPWVGKTISWDDIPVKGP